MSVSVILRSLALSGVLLAQTATGVRAAEIPNFALLDAKGQNHELHRAAGRAVVLFFTGVGCPVVRKTAEKVRDLKKRFGNDLTVWLVDSELSVERESVLQEAKELGLADFPVLLDSKQAVAQALDVQRTAE